MERQRITVRRSLTRLGLAFACLGAGIAGCQNEGSIAGRGDPASLELPDLGADCVTHQGFTHCPLGEAKLDPDKDQPSLKVVSLREPGKDGVAIVLPEVTDFVASGLFDGESAGSTLIARAASESVSASTLTVKRAEDSFVVSAAFPDRGAGSTYHMNLYRGGELVGTITDLESEGEGTQLRMSRCCLRKWLEDVRFKILDLLNFTRPGGSSAEGAGACVWSLALEKGQELEAILPDGTKVAADLVELVEDVRGADSYPYLTFNRIDFTSDGGDLRLDDEQINAEPPPYGTDCVDHQGFKHCPLGDAKLDPEEDGKVLAVGPLRTVGKDGVAILLPDTTRFVASGEMEYPAGTSLIARTINEGVSTSTMTLRRTNGGFAVSAMFTGSGAASTHNIYLYKDGVVVSKFLAVPNDYIEEIQLEKWDLLLWLWGLDFRINQDGDNAGACVWRIVLDRNQKAVARLANGTEVAVDTVELEENVRGDGSYPYLTFNRIDYSTDSGVLRIDDERAK